jgi:hypothetical protein
MSINRPIPGDTDEQLRARRNGKPKRFRAPRLGQYRPASGPARMVLSPWTVEPNGVMSRELRGV